MLEALEEGAQGKGPTALIDDLPLFSAAPAARTAAPRESAAEDRLREVHPDALSPRQALELVYELKALIEVP